MKGTLIAEGSPPLLPAIRTQRWQRDLLFLSIKDRRDFVVKREVSVGDLKACRALRTRLLHWKEVYRMIWTL